MRQDTTDEESRLFFYLLFEFFPSSNYLIIDIRNLWEIVEDQT